MKGRDRPRREPKKKKAPRPSVPAIPDETIANVIWWVERTVGTEKERASGQIPTMPFATPPAYVRRGATATIKVADADDAAPGEVVFAKVDASVTMPCYPAELEEASRWADAFIGRQLDESIDEVQAKLIDGKRRHG